MTPNGPGDAVSPFLARVFALSYARRVVESPGRHRACDRRVRNLSAALAALALLAVTASSPSARADEGAESEPEIKTPIEGRDAMHLTGSALVLGGGLALLPAAYVASTVAVGAIDSGSSGAESAARDFQEPIVFTPLAAGFCALMIGAALLVVVSPPTSPPARTHAPSRAAQATRNPFVFTF